MEFSSQDYIDLNQFKCIKSIGKGCFGEVMLIEDKKTHTPYAAKITLQEISQSDEISDEMLNLFREIKIMSAIDHPSIVRCLGYCPTNFQNRPYPTYITEYIPNGSLTELIKLENQGLKPDGWNSTKKLICIYGIASGINFLHKHGIIHRDLKPDNIMMDESYLPKITDFGLSKAVDELTKSLSLQSNAALKGTPIFSAPEAILNNEYSKAGDVYSFAMIVYAIVSGELPIIKHTTLFDLMNKLQKGERPKISKSVPEVYNVFISSCWSQQVEERPTFEDILDVLKVNTGFISEGVDQDEFLAYVNMIDNCKSSFDTSKINIHIGDFLNKDKNAKGSDDDEETEYEIEYQYEYEEEDDDEPKKIVEKEEEIEKPKKIDEKEEDEEEPKKIDEKEEEIEKPKKIDEKEEDKVEDSKKFDEKEKLDITDKKKDKGDEKDKPDKKVKSDKKKEGEKDKNCKKVKSDKKKEKGDEKDKPDKKVKSDKKKEGEKDKPCKKVKSDKKKEKGDEKDKKEKKKKTEKTSKKSNVNETEKDTSDEPKKVKKIIYPIEEREQLEKECQKLVKEAEKDPQKQFLVGKHLILGTGNFPYSIQLGIKYLRQSSKNGCDESSLLLGKIYVDGKIIPKDIEEAKKILENVEDKEDSEYLLLIGRIEHKEGNLKRAFKDINKSVKLGNPEAMYRIGKMYLKGKGIEKDTKKADEYINLATTNGFVKSIISSPIPKNKITILIPEPNNNNNNNTSSNLPLNTDDVISSPKFQIRNRNNTFYHQRNQIHTQYPIESPTTKAQITSKSPPIYINMTFVGDKDCGKHRLVYLLSKGLLPQEIPDLIENPMITSNIYGELFRIKLIENYGQEEDKDANLISYLNANIFVMVYSLIEKTTLDNLTTKWINEIQNYTNYTYIVLLGLDLEKWSVDANNENYVTQKDIENAQKVINARSSIRCSLETGENVNDLKNKVIGGYAMQFYNPESYKNSSNAEDLKVLLVGNYDGGQYELLQYIQNDEFNENVEPNPVNRVDKLVTLKGKKEKNCHFYSTPGDPSCNKIRFMAYHDSQIVLLVFSLTKSLSLANLIANYKMEVDQFARSAAIVLVGVDVDNWTDNKSDLKITHSSQIKNFLSAAGIHTFIKCSYTTGKNMDSFYEKIIDAYESHKKKKGKKF